MKIEQKQHDKTQEILNAVSSLVILNAEYPHAVSFALNTLMPERSYGREKVKPSIGATRNKVLAEVVLQDDLNEQEVVADVESRKNKS